MSTNVELEKALAKVREMEEQLDAAYEYGFSDGIKTAEKEYKQTINALRRQNDGLRASLKMKNG